MAAQFVEQNLHATIQNINPILHASFEKQEVNYGSKRRKYSEWS